MKERIVSVYARGAVFHRARVEQRSGLGSLNPALLTINKQLAAAVVGGCLAEELSSSQVRADR